MTPRGINARAITPDRALSSQPDQTVRLNSFIRRLILCHSAIAELFLNVDGPSRLTLESKHSDNIDYVTLTSC